MKKIIALLLALVMLASLTVTALATGEQTGTTTLTAVVPEPSYTIHVPADMTLEFGNGEVQEVGSFYVSDLVNVNRTISVLVTRSNLANGSNTIPVTYYFKSGSADWSIPSDGSVFGVYNKLSDGTMFTSTWKIGAQVTESDWTSATPGTYTTTLTFKFNFND